MEKAGFEFYSYGYTTRILRLFRKMPWLGEWSQAEIAHLINCTIVPVRSLVPFVAL
jgi:hypothetical protein